MLDISSLKPELRYGCPAADQILTNRFYSVGYSYYFRQAKWSLEIIDQNKQDMTKIERLNDFRPDFRVPKAFRADLSDYSASGYDRGHLVASADQDETEIQNSETFLLSNMCPQAPEFNRLKWKMLETAVRSLDAQKEVLETYVISGPIFDLTEPTKMIGEQDKHGISIPVPSHFFKCVLAEKERGQLQMWAFEMPNGKLEEDLSFYRKPTSYIEQRAGISLWHSLSGTEIDKEKNKVRAMWKT